MHRSARLATAGLLLAALPLLAPARAGAADEAPPNPFGEVASHFRLGRTVRLRGAIVVTVVLPDAWQVNREAQVGLGGAKVEILPLPGPAGVWHVRIANEGKTPLLVPTGDTILTPLQASRSTDRAVWIAPGGATFVPVVQAPNDPPQGPYVARGRGLTPFEQTMIPPDRWAERVAARNRRFGVVGAREDDAAGVYVTDAFDAVRKANGGALDAAVVAPTTVGVFVADDRGPFFAHIQTSAERFKAHWPFLRDGILLDADMVEQVGGAPRPGDEGELRQLLQQLLAVLDTKPLNRPNFGEGWEYRWPITNPPGHWDGLGTLDGAISLRLYRYPVRPAGAPTPGGTGEGPPEVPDPGNFEDDRKLRPTEYEKRLRERRERLRERNQPRAPSAPAGGQPAPGQPAPGQPPPPTRPGTAPAPQPPAPQPPGQQPPGQPRPSGQVPRPSLPGRR